MNKDRRKRINEIRAELEDLIAKAEEIAADLGDIRDEEQDYLDNMPEGLQSSERAEIAEAAVNALEEALGVIGDFVESGAVESLDQAAE